MKNDTNSGPEPPAQARNAAIVAVVICVCLLIGALLLFRVDSAIARLAAVVLVIWGIGALVWVVRVMWRRLF